MSAIRPYEPASAHWDTARERDVDMKLDAEERDIDSREKLEADVQKHFTHRTNTVMWPPSANKTTDWLSVSMETVLGWLDRQAAITEQECIDQRIADQIGSIWKGKKVRKLQAKADALTEECDMLHRQVELKDGIIEGLRKSLDETIEERNELQAKLDDFDGDCYCGATAVQWHEHSVRLQDQVDKLKQELAERDGAVCERDGRINAYERRNTDLHDALKAICNRYGVGTKWAAEDAAKKVFESIDSAYMRLPVDADGVPIHVGDVLNPPAGCDDYMPLQVVRLTYDGYENEWFFDGEAGGFCGMVGEHMDVAGWTHHHAPTVEDVLREFADEVWNRCCEGATASDSGIDELVAEYAERIRKAVSE